MRWAIQLLLCCACLGWGPVQAAEPVLGQWFRSTDNQPVDTPRLTHFNYRFEAEIALSANQPQVLVFSGSHVWELAEVLLLSDGQQVWRKCTGAMSHVERDFFLRNDLALPRLDGRFQLQVNYRSRFTIVAPQLELWDRAEYQRHYLNASTYTLISLGILFALCIHYGALTFTRVESCVAFYAAFVGLNILFFANATLVTPAWFGLKLFELSYLPILFSNPIYVLFVLHLLRIDRRQDKLLWHIGAGLVGLMAICAVAGVLLPAYANEINRVNVNLFLLFGTGAALWRTLQRDRVGLLYLLANLGFVVFGLWATHASIGSSERLMQVEHVGLLGITFESLMLALLMAYRLHLGEQERVAYLQASQQALQLAYTDALTSTRSRLAFDRDIQDKQPGTLLALIDLNDLKGYNDREGHERGDKYLVQFCQYLLGALTRRGQLYRLGGDEFVVLSEQLTPAEVQQLIAEVIVRLNDAGFVHAGAAVGIAVLQADQSRGDWINQADSMMYQDKKATKSETGQNA